MAVNTNRPQTLMSKPAVVVALDEIVAGLKRPPMENPAQLQALADAVQAGRDEWVVTAARKALACCAKAQRRSFWQ